MTSQTGRGGRKGRGTVEVGHDGQLTLPKDLMSRLGIKDGGQVDLVETADGVLIRRVKRGDIRDLKGIIPKPARAVSVAAMNRALSRMGR